MLPDVRLLIAATVASVMALICGFAIFATLRVSYEPLVRLPPAATPPRLVADSGAPPMAFAATEPFDRRFHLSEAQPPGEAVASLLRMLERRQEADQGAQSAIDPSPAAIAAAIPATEATLPAAAAATQTAAVASVVPTAETAPPAPAPNDQPLSDQAPAASKPAALAAAASAEASPPSPSPQVPAVTETAPPAPATPSVAAVEPAPEPTPASAQPTDSVDTAPATVATAAAAPATVQATEDAAAKKTKHSRLATRIHRARIAFGGVAASQLANQNSSFPQSNFQTASQWQQPQSNALAAIKNRRAKIAAAKTRDPATGGPFVTAPNR